MKIKNTCKKIKSFALVIAMITSFVPCFTASASETLEDLTYGSTTIKDADGDGAYEIGTLEELKAFTYHVNAGKTTINAKLTDDIVYNSDVVNKIKIENTNYGTVDISQNGVNSMTPIGNTKALAYSGIFDGNGHSISGIYVPAPASSEASNVTTQAKGVFGYVKGTVKNLTIKDTCILGNTRAGGIVGFLDAGIVENCKFIEGVISNYGSMTGGIAGYATSDWTYDSNGKPKEKVAPKIENCSISDVTFYAYGTDLGGIVGQTNGYSSNPVEIRNCTNNSKIAATGYSLSGGKVGATGGIVGGFATPTSNTTANWLSVSSVIIENCTNNGEVTISGGIQNNIGVCGIAGRVGTNGKIVNCVNNAAINSETSSAAGIALVTECSIKGCTNNGNITAGDGSAAGIACELSGGGIITECINNGKITENLGSANYNYSGGIVANCRGSSTAVNTVSKCINTGDVSGYNNVGGITGYVYHTNISLCGNTGKVTGTNNYVGGVTSQLGMGSTIENCYNLGDVSAADNAGGLVGTFTLLLTLDYGNNSVSNSYASCKVTATGENATAIGGLSGSLPSITKNGNTYKSTLKDSIYDTAKYTGEAYGSTDDENSNTGEALNLQGVTAAQFKSGEVCYILNGQTSESTDENSLVWGQHIGKEDYPVFGGKIVYLSDGIYHNEIEEFVILQNSANNGNAVAKIAVPTSGTYTVVFADYEGGALKSVNMVEVTSAGGEIVTATSTEPITLGSKDKIMLWSDLNKFAPKCNAYVID